MQFDTTQDCAMKLDAKDELREFRHQFFFPSTHEDPIYLNANSLGLQPKITQDFVQKELEDWKQYGVKGHFTGDTAWVNYHEFLTEGIAELLGAELDEVVITNSITTNLHLLMVSFYQPDPKRYKVLMEYSPFPSDQYAVKSQIKFHGFDPHDAVIQLGKNADIVSNEEIEEVFSEHGDEIALVLIGGINYLTGQLYDMEWITKLGHKHGCIVGFDLAHAIGNVALKLHQWDVDFAVFCTYKYLNSGPGATGGLFVNQRFANAELPRFAGWWGHDKQRRFLMEPEFIPIPGAEGWQLSGAPILNLAAIRASLTLFKEAGLERLFNKRKKLNDYMSYLIEQIDSARILTPEQRGAQLSLIIDKGGKQVYEALLDNGVFADWREPNVIRIAPNPMYNSFMDCYRFYTVLQEVLKN